MPSVTVLLFASYADALGLDRVAVELPAGARVAAALAHVRALAAGRALPSTPLLAVNARYAGADQLLQDGDEVALIPPVAGG